MASTSKRRAHHATKACNSCRRRRCKCDGVHPICGTCTFYGHECTWSQEEDARRPATKQLVESLRVRIRELESELSQLRVTSANIETARTSMVPSSASSDAPAEPTKPESQPEFSGQSHLTMQEGNISASGPTSMWSTFPSDDLSPQPRPSLDNHSYQYIFQRDPNIPDHLQPRATQLSDQCEWDRNLCLTQLDPAVGFDRMEHDVLLDKCFNFHTVWLRVVEPDFFLRDMLAQLTPGYPNLNAHQARSLSYSPFLHCALMSFATAFSDNPKVKAKQTRTHFAQCAKQHLESECERPTITVVQALTFLSDFHGSLGDRGLAYLYSGMACRIVRALGLCIDSRPWVESKRITPEELVARDWQFWSTFCQDKIMSLDYGRDYDIPLPHLNVNLPQVIEHLDQRPWPGDRLQPSIETERPQPNRATQVFFETCKLMLFGVRIMDAVYSQGRQNWRVTQKDSVSEIHLQLDTWYNNLPENFTISARSTTKPLPHIIVLNMAYWWLLLILHRPFYARTVRSASNASTEIPSSFTDLSVKICDRATVKIVQYIMVFDKHYGMRYFPLGMLQVIFMAGATLLVQSATLSESAVKKRSDAHEGTRKCIHALQAAAQTWDCAQLSANHLQSLLQEQTGEASVQTPLQLQGQVPSAESSPMTYSHPPLPNTGAPGAYETVSASLPTAAQLYREFVSQQDYELGYSVSIPSQIQHHLQYPALHQLHQQPLMGMPCGAQFMQNPHVLPLPYDPNFNEGYTMHHGNGADYFPDRSLTQPHPPHESSTQEGQESFL
ncbi:Nitrogen assimilation transcription factor nirA [Aspergillus nidulans FGSC A4] [Rhizoctonia solani]|uniref:Nitrogen assimilation transcription factor nirA [Aspergillus nidulans FGSC A4] n=1 Tax=Rhizoctonia solani TaxID=456999 RepID=A0A0K6FXB5_9AGAM|nr:Nitrogen assimilation transcription factor nirA [Aspergillus nidulans FGSC A4] [Rhizoctonia solani]